MSEFKTQADVIKAYNALDGVVPVKRFTDMKTALRRYQEAINGDGGNGKTKPKPVKVKPAKAEPAKTVGRKPTFTHVQNCAKDTPRFQEGSKRGTVWVAIEKAGRSGISIAALEKVLGFNPKPFVDKLLSMKYISAQ